LVHASHHGGRRSYPVDSLKTAIIGVLSRFGLNASSVSKYWPRLGRKALSDAHYSRLGNRSSRSGKILINAKLNTRFAKTYLVICKSILDLSAYDLGTGRYLIKFRLAGKKEGDLTYKKAAQICMKQIISGMKVKLRRQIDKLGIREKR